MKSALALKYIFSLLIYGFCITCTDLDRENPLDPKNPSSRTDNVHLIEAFVNTNSTLDTLGLDYSKRAIVALNEIKALYGNQVIICEYHRNSKTVNYPDPYALIDNRYEVLYSNYVESNAVSDKGVPDIFINGAANRIQGAYSSTSVKERIIDIISDLSLVENEYIFDTDISIVDNSINVKCKVARLRNRSVDNLRLRLIFTRDFGQSFLQNVVVAENQIGSYSKSVPRINAGDFENIRFDSIRFDFIPDMITLALTNEDGSEVLSSVRVGL